MICVCLGNVVSDGCTFNGLELKTELVSQTFSVCRVIFVCMYFEGDRSGNRQ